MTIHEIAARDSRYCEVIVRRLLQGSLFSGVIR